jgi:hypothetical protein
VDFIGLSPGFIIYVVFERVFGFSMGDKSGVLVKEHAGTVISN